MVYRGRPSAACLSCRARRIKCNRESPQCAQCTRIAIDCPGYRDPLDQIFRNENENVVERANKSYKKPKHTKGKHRAVTEHKNCNDVTLRTPENALLPQSIEDVAVADFMLCYIPGSYFDYLPWMYGQTATGDSLRTIVHAASMALLSRKLGQTALMEMARRSYARALLDTNAALADPRTAVLNTTLVSVLLLSSFEAIVWAHTRTPESWNTHTRGALALIKLRGPQQFEDPNSRKLFLQVANRVLVNSLRQNTRVPQDLEDLIEMTLCHESESPRYRLMRLTSQVSNLVADVTARNMTAKGILEATCRMDEQYISYAEGMPSSWQYLVLLSDESRPEVYGSVCHCYPNLQVAKVWNSYRMTRILLNEAIHAHAHYNADYMGRKLQRQAVENIEQMAIEICASIPQFANPSEFCKAPVSLATSTEPMAPTASVPALLWPLSSIRGASLVSEDVRKYAVKQLQYLGWKFCVPQAQKIALETCNFDALQDGLHMFYLL